MSRRRILCRTIAVGNFSLGLGQVDFDLHTLLPGQSSHNPTPEQTMCKVQQCLGAYFTELGSGRYRYVIKPNFTFSDQWLPCVVFLGLPIWRKGLARK